MTYQGGQLAVLADTLDSLIYDYQDYQSEDIGRQILSKLRIYADRGVSVKTTIINKEKN